MPSGNDPEAILLTQTAILEYPDDELPSYAARIFRRLRAEATQMQQQSPLSMTLTQTAILEHTSLPAALAALLAARLSSCAEECEAMRSTMASALGTAPLLRAVLCDLAKIIAVDPAVEAWLQPVLFFKGFHALTTHRVAHLLWQRGDKPAALLLQSRNSERFAVDIHPGARVGSAAGWT